MLKLEDIIMLQKIIQDVTREYGRLNITEVAKRSGFNKRTIMKYANPSNESLERVESKKQSKLEPYKPEIQEILKEKPHLSGKAIYAYIISKGYKGKYTIVTDYLRYNRPQQQSKLAVLRYETAPGEQAQTDWGTLCRVEIDGKMTSVYAFAMVLGFSRVIYAEITTSQDEMTFLRCMVNAFNYFGGVPENILFDNMKTVIIKKAFDPKKNEWNKTFKDFSEYYGFKPHTHQPYHPQTKGKIERTIQYIKGSFFTIREFASIEDMNKQLQDWLVEANNRVHGTTKKVPFVELKKEIPKLKDISTIPPYSITITEKRKISPDACLSFMGNKYSVPHQYARMHAILKVSSDSFTVFCNGAEVCTHKIAHGSGRSIILKEHSAGLLKATMERNRERNPAPEVYELKFKDLQVEERSLKDYDDFGLFGGTNDNTHL